MERISGVNITAPEEIRSAGEMEIEPVLRLKRILSAFLSSKIDAAAFESMVNQAREKYKDYLEGKNAA